MSAAPSDGGHWLAALTDEAIARRTGDGALARGRAYARDGSVTGLAAGGHGEVLLATVRGTRPVPYQVVVRARPDGRWAGTCTCPVASDCKHVAAVLLQARDRVRRGGSLSTAGGPAGDGGAGSDGSRAGAGGSGGLPAWERQLGDLLGGREPVGTVPLALLVEVVEVPTSRFTGRPEAGTRVRLRPARPGATGAWIRTGASWRDLELPGLDRPLVPDQRDALLELARAARAHQAGWYSTYAETTVHLDDLGPGGWRTLADAVRAGVTLVSELGSRAAAARPVVLADAPAEVTLDLRRTGPGGARAGADSGVGADSGAGADSRDSGDAVLEAVVSVPGEPPLPARRVELVGDPPHGLFVDDPRRLLLAAFDRPPDPLLTRLLATRRPLTVPAADVPRFLERWYPVLRRRTPVVSTDESIALPELAPPRLGAEVTFSEPHRVTLRWSVRYRVGDRVHAVPLPGERRRSGDEQSREHPDDGPAAVPRDADAEQALVDSLAGLDVMPGLRTTVSGPRGTSHRLVARVELSGLDTAAFVEQVLPVLDSDPGVELAVRGSPAEYGEASDAPLVSVSSRPSTERGRTDWFDLGIAVTVDGQVVQLSELVAALARGDRRMLLVSGTWFRLDTPELARLRALVEEARALTDRPVEALQITRWQAGLWEDLVALGVVDHQSGQWSRSVGALLALDEVPAPPVPDSLDAELRPYQVHGYQWLSLLAELGLGGILADDMGLGKTVQVLAALARQAAAGRLGGAAGPVLVVAPTSVVGTWVTQAARFTPDVRVAAVTETTRRSGRGPAAVAGSCDVVVTSYALLRIDAEQYTGLQWAGLVLDEAQAVKNHHGRTYQAARRVSAGFRFAVTGTPLENSLMDLWALLSLSAPGLFPDPSEFTTRYRNPVEVDGNRERLALLRRRIRPLVLRRTKEAIATDLPPKVEQVLEVTLNPAHRRLYDRQLARERQRVLGLLEDLQRNRMAVFRSLTALRQLSLDASLVVPDSHARSSKIDALLDHLGEVVAEGHRVLVFSQFTRFLGMVRDRLRAEGIAHVHLDGRTRDRAGRIAEFTGGTAPVFLISLKAGGVGLTLTEADYVYVLDPWWNPAAEAQAVDRAHRIGQDRTVMVYRLVATDTIEEKVVALQQRKRDLFARVVDGDGLLAGQLSAEDIRGLFEGT